MDGNYPIEAVANTILDEAEGREILLSPMKLQKLMYLAHGYYIAVTGQPLTDEDFEAWQYGPVSPTIYHEFKDFGASPIKTGKRATRRYWDNGEVNSDTPTIPESDRRARAVINFVLNTYGGRSAVYLSDLTHKVGSPWEHVRSAAPLRRNSKIDNSLIRDYFGTLVKG